MPDGKGLTEIRVFRKDSSMHCVSAKKGTVTWSTAADNNRINAVTDPTNGVVKVSNGLIVWDFEELNILEKGGDFKERDHPYTIAAVVEGEPGNTPTVWSASCFFKSYDTDDIEYFKEGLA